MGLMYGINSVLEALKAPKTRVERISVQRDQSNPRIKEIIKLGREKHLPLSFEDKSWLDRKCEGQHHQGVVCFVAEMETLSIEEILEQAVPPGLLVVLDGIEDPRNLGAILQIGRA